MKRRTPCIVCAAALACIAAAAGAQQPGAKSHDALAQARATAKLENQRVLLYLNGGDVSANAALSKALGDYRALGKLVRYEYQLVALPAASLAATALRGKLGLAGDALPMLAVLDTEDALLAKLDAAAMRGDRAFVPAPVRRFLDENKCEPVHARRVLADGLAIAKKSKRHAFVYLSAPW